MPTYITRGPARVTITELRGPGPALALIVLAALSIGFAVRYARTIEEAVTISVTVLFGLTGAAVITGTVLTIRRIRAELRATRSAAAAGAIEHGRDTLAGQLRSRAAPAIEPGPVVDVKPEWIIPRKARP